VLVFQLKPKWQKHHTEQTQSREDKNPAQRKKDFQFVEKFAEGKSNFNSILITNSSQICPCDLPLMIIGILNVSKALLLKLCSERVSKVNHPIAVKIVMVVYI